MGKDMKMTWKLSIFWDPWGQSGFTRMPRQSVCWCLLFVGFLLGGVRV